jgi:hypothetical protein
MLLKQLQIDSATEKEEAGRLIVFQQQVVEILQTQVKHQNKLPAELQAAMGPVVGATTQSEVCQAQSPAVDFQLYI